MAGRIVAKAVVEVDNVLSDTDESGSYIEIEVDSEGNEIVAGTTSNQHDGMTATVRTSSASVGGIYFINITFWYTATIILIKYMPVSDMLSIINKIF